MNLWIVVRAEAPTSRIPKDHLSPKTMRIAHVSPLIESCPPTLYGGTERIVSYLTEELVRLGHEVTLLASGDSQTAARLIASCPRALRLDPDRSDPIAYQMIALHRFAATSGQFDVMHFHTDYLHFPFFAGVFQPTLTTMHGRLDLPHVPAVFAEFPAMPLVSISDNQRRPAPGANWLGTVYHGLPPDLIPPGNGRGRYLAFLGRISPEKRVDRAIEIAHRAHLPLRIAAKVDAADRDYFEASIRPLFGDPLVEYLGEIGDDQKSDFLGDAAALLFPIDWPEPFGLVMIEAMAAGTPVIAFHRGSGPEGIDDGVTGFVVADMDEAAEAVGRALALDRGAVRARFEQRFTVGRMVRDYLELYWAIAASPALDAALRDVGRLRRLPELFCGFKRRQHYGPTFYPTACAPQAWASASLLGLIKASLGLTFYQSTGRIQFSYPVLPRFIEELRLGELELGDSRADVTLRQHGGDVSVNVTRRTNDIRVMVVH